jgi:restriction endonuclease
MILGFKRNFPWGPETKFKDKIIAAVRPTPFVDEPRKIHTIRKGWRWQPGRFIHFAYGQRTKNYECFFHGTVKTVQGIIIYTDIQEVRVATKGVDNSYFFDYQKISEDQVKELAKNDGFDCIEDFWKWFTVDVKGQIICWKEKVYMP